MESKKEREFERNLFDLDRFVKAQDKVDIFKDGVSTFYESALAEIKSGKKIGHWMWFIFPQEKGLGSSVMSEYYGLLGVSEAGAYYRHPVLGKRLREITEALLYALVVGVADGGLDKIFPYPDNLKIRSCMKLFYKATGDELFKKVLDAGDDYEKGDKE